MNCYSVIRDDSDDTWGTPNLSSRTALIVTIVSNFGNNYRVKGIENIKNRQISAQSKGVTIVTILVGIPPKVSSRATFIVTAVYN